MAIARIKTQTDTCQLTMGHGGIEEGCLHIINRSQLEKSIQVNTTGIWWVLICTCVEGKRNRKVETIVSTLRRLWNQLLTSSKRHTCK